MQLHYKFKYTTRNMSWKFKIAHRYPCFLSCSIPRFNIDTMYTKLHETLKTSIVVNKLLRLVATDGRKTNIDVFPPMLEMLNMDVNY